MKDLRVILAACLLLLAGSVFAQDVLDPSFAPVIRGPGTVRALAWHAATGRVYASVNADKLNGQALTTSLVRFDADGNWDVGYAPVLNGSISHIVVAPDGRMLLAGSFTAVDGHATSRLARLLSDGSVDRSFVTSGGALPPTATAMAVGADGWTYIGSSSTVQTGGTRLLTRVSPSGVVSAGIGPRLGITAALSGTMVGIRALHVTESGDLFVGGNFTEVEGSPKGFLAKVGPAGELRADYPSSLGKAPSGLPTQTFALEGSPGVAAILPAGGDAIYVGGLFDSVNGQPQRAVARLDAGGASDPAFRIQFTTTAFFPYEPYVERMARDSAGRLILVGSLDRIASVQEVIYFRSVRVDSSGAHDPTFSSLIWSTDRVVVLPGDDVVFGRAASLAMGGIIQPALGKISAAGVTSTTFRPDLRIRRPADWLLPRPGLGPLLGGTWMMEVGGVDVSGGLASLSLSGVPDSLFANQASPNAPIRDALRLPDGRFLLGGAFSQMGGVAVSRLALVGGDGRPAADFDLGGGPNSEVTLLRLLPSGRVLVGGYFDWVAGELCKNVFVLDLSKIGASPNVRVLEILAARYGTATVFSDVKGILQAALDDGQLSVGVNSAAMGGDPAPGALKTLQVEFRTDRGITRTARISEGGTLLLPNLPWDSGLIDPGFAPAHTESLWLRDAAEQSDGRILLLGSFSSFAGSGIGTLVRLERNGNLDTAFNPKAQFSSFSPSVIRVDAQDRIYVAGPGMRVSTSSSSRAIHRLAANGTVDAGFSCPSFITSVEKLVVTPDDSVWCAGDFPGTEPSGRRRIARLTASGALDTRFAAGDSANATISGLHLEPPGRLWLTGTFTLFQGATRDGVALVNLANPVPPLARIVPRSVVAQEGAGVRFELAEAGVGESYVWRRNGTVVSGASGPSLEFSGVEPHHAGFYEAEITNSAGLARSGGTLTVQEATLEQWMALRGLAANVDGADADGDGASNAEEYLTRTDPNDAGSVFRMGMESFGGSFLLRWPAYPGRTYIVEESSDLSQWIPISPALTSDQGEETFEVPFAPGGGSLFWRLQVSK